MARTGEKRKVRQPFAVDKLPPEARDAIMRLRAQGKTWLEIEELSPSFAGRPLGHSVLQRWYDVRVEQVVAEQMARGDRARAIAQQFATRGIKELPQAITAALTEKIFALMEAADSKSDANVVSALLELGHLVAKLERNQLAAGQLGIEREKVELLKKKIVGLKEAVGKKKLAGPELQQKLDEIYGIVKG